MNEEVVPVLYVSDVDRAVAWYGRLGFVKEWEHQFEPGFPWFVSVTRGSVRLYLSEQIPVDEDGLAGRECGLTDPDGNRLRVATRRSG